MAAAAAKEVATAADSEADSEAGETVAVASAEGTEAVDSVAAESVAGSAGVGWVAVETAVEGSAAADSAAVAYY